MPETSKTGWALLHSKLPSVALHALPQSAYGVSGLTDVNEAYLIQRLFASGLTWDWRLLNQEYLGFEDRAVRDKDYTMRYYLASVQGELSIDGRVFHGAGAHDNRKLDAAFKGAATVAFKNACKIAGLTIELFKDGKAMDFIYESRDGEITPSKASAESLGTLQEAQGVGLGGPAFKPPASPAVEVNSGAAEVGNPAASPAQAPWQQAEEKVKQTLKKRGRPPKGFSEAAEVAKEAEMDKIHRRMAEPVLDALRGASDALP